MKVFALVVAVLVAMSVSAPSFAAYNGARNYENKPAAAKAASARPGSNVSTYHDAQGIERVQKSGEIYRNPKVLHDFKRNNPKPTDGRKYEAHHVKPLSEGGSDSVNNQRRVEKSEHKQITAEGARKGHGYRSMRK